MTSWEVEAKALFTRIGFDVDFGVDDNSRPMNVNGVLQAVEK